MAIHSHQCGSSPAASILWLFQAGMPAFSLLFLKGTFAHLEVSVLLIVSVSLEGDLLLRGVDVEVLQRRPNRAGWGQPLQTQDTSRPAASGNLVGGQLG